MVKTTVFKSNKLQAVRLPKAVALPDNVKSVDVVAVGNTRIISPAGQAWEDWFDESSVSADCLAERDQQKVQKRESFDD